MKSEKEIKEIIESKFQLKESGQRGFYKFKDPEGIHRDLSWAINFRSNVVIDHRSGITMSIPNFISRFLGLKVSYFVDKNSTHFNFKINNPINLEILPKNYTLDINNSFTNIAIKYLNKRNIYNYLDYGLRVTADIKANNIMGIIIPFFYEERIEYFTIRNIFNGNKHYNPENITKPLFYNQMVFEYGDFNKPLYIVEGVFDCLTLLEGGVQAVASLGWNLNRRAINKILLSNFKEIVIFADHGFYRKQVNNSLEFVVTGKDIKIVNFDSLDIETEKDVNDVGFDRAMDMVSKTEYLTLQNYFKI